jgi:hypothetical protein
MIGKGEIRVYLDGARNGCVGESNLGFWNYAPAAKRVRTMGVGQACERLGAPVIESTACSKEPRAVARFPAERGR